MINAGQAHGKMSQMATQGTNNIVIGIFSRRLNWGALGTSWGSETCICLAIMPLGKWTEYSTLRCDAAMCDAAIRNAAMRDATKAFI